jgi:hypothetical protein
MEQPGDQVNGARAKVNDIGWESPPNEFESMRRSRGDPPKKTAPSGQCHLAKESSHFGKTPTSITTRWVFYGYSGAYKTIT